MERQTREMRRVAVESGRGKGVMFNSVKAILAAVSAITSHQDRRVDTRRSISFPVQERSAMGL